MNDTSNLRLFLFFFCRNGNICNCKAGTIGKHCEFFGKETFPCLAQCKNGGKCQIGLRNATAEEIKMDKGADPNHSFSHCTCPKGWTGDLCQFKTEKIVKCGETICLNGATCLTDKKANGFEQFHCDCTKATNKSVAGNSCEHEATTFCTADKGVNGRHFCANNGVCVDQLDG